MQTTMDKDVAEVSGLMPFLTVGILAGGASKRFGSPKHQALLAEQSLLDHVAQTAAQLSRQVILGCGQHKLSQSSLQQVVDPPDGQYGPVSGIIALLEKTTTTWLLTLPVDMPLVTTNTLRELANHRLPDKPVACYADGRHQPLLAIWPCTLKTTLARISGAKRSSVVQMMEQLNCFYIKPTSRRLPEIEFANINRRSDLQKLQEAL